MVPPLTGVAPVLGAALAAVLGAALAASLAPALAAAVGAVVAVLLAWFAILFTGWYPRALFDYVVGVLRWGLRVGAYAVLLTTDTYPPFRLAA
jgi:hypothetical protein